MAIYSESPQDEEPLEYLCPEPIDPRTYATIGTGRQHADRPLDFLADWVVNG
jgi:hypothetical protein